MARTGSPNIAPRASDDATGSERPPTATSPRSSAKRTAILNGARDAFLEHGFESASMDVVAAAAQVSKATVYVYFGSKADLFGAIVERACDEILTVEGVVPQLDKAVESWLPEFAVAYARKLFEPQLLALLRLAIGGSRDTRQVGKLFLNKGPEPARQGLARIFREMHHRGQLDIDDALLAVDQFISMIVPTRLYALLDAAQTPSRSEVDRHARAGARRFIQAYRPGA